MPGFLRNETTFLKAASTQSDAPTATLIGTVNTNNTNTHTVNQFTPNIPADTEDIFVLITATDSSLGSVSSVTVGGNGATEIVAFVAPGTNNVTSSIWHLTSPPTGNQQITTTFSNDVKSSAVAPIRVLDLGSIGDSDQRQGTNDNVISVDLTTATVNSTLIMMGALKGGDMAGFTPLANVDELADDLTGGGSSTDHSFFVGRMDAPTADTYTIGATNDVGSEDFTASAVELKSA